MSPRAKTKQEKPWYEVVTRIRPHVVRILTPRGSGTGFLFHRSKGGHLVGLATAAHVIDQTHYWEEPLRLYHAESGTNVLLRVSDRAVFLDPEKDTAALVIQADKLPLPTKPLDLIQEGKVLKVGNQIGWLGFPAVASAQLCFFGGRVSAWNAEGKFYLVDGVAINGVSGGPAFYIKVGSNEALMGVLSAYIPNRATGEVLPGLAVVRDVSQFHELIKNFKSVDEAKVEETPSSEVPSQPTEPSGETPPDIPTKRSV